jgi:hypothetical protein
MTGEIDESKLTWIHPLASLYFQRSLRDCSTVIRKSAVQAFVAATEMRSTTLAFLNGAQGVNGPQWAAEIRPSYFNIVAALTNCAQPRFEMNVEDWPLTTITHYLDMISRYALTSIQQELLTETVEMLLGRFVDEHPHYFVSPDLQHHILSLAAYICVRNQKNLAVSTPSSNSTRRISILV